VKAHSIYIQCRAAQIKEECERKRQERSQQERIRKQKPLTTGNERQLELKRQRLREEERIEAERHAKKEALIAAQRHRCCGQSHR
jgi:hypothetical protein